VKVKTALEMSRIANVITNKQQISTFGSFFLFSFSPPLLYSPLNNNFLLQLEHLQFKCPLQDRVFLLDAKGVHLKGQNCPFHPLKVKIVQGMCINLVPFEVEHSNVM
jgi:hypothetical protein